MQRIADHGPGHDGQSYSTKVSEFCPLLINKNTPWHNKYMSECYMIRLNNWIASLFGFCIEDTHIHTFPWNVFIIIDVNMARLCNCCVSSVFISVWYLNMFGLFVYFLCKYFCLKFWNLVHWNRKWNSSPTVWQNGHSLLCLSIFEYLPTSTGSLWLLVLNLSREVVCLSGKHLR